MLEFAVLDAENMRNKSMSHKATLACLLTRGADTGGPKDVTERPPAKRFRKDLSALSVCIGLVVQDAFIQGGGRTKATLKMPAGTLQWS